MFELICGILILAAIVVYFTKRKEKLKTLELEEKINSLFGED